MNAHDEHLDVILELAKASARCPQLRIGQLIANALPAGVGGDPFYIPDADLAEALKEYGK